jgi:hypothetical protein
MEYRRGRMTEEYRTRSSIPLLLAAAPYAVSVGLHGHGCLGFACYASWMLFCVRGGVLAIPSTYLRQLPKGFTRDASTYSQLPDGSPIL